MKIAMKVGSLVLALILLLCSCQGRTPTTASSKKSAVSRSASSQTSSSAVSSALVVSSESELSTADAEIIDTDTEATVSEPNTGKYTGPMMTITNNNRTSYTIVYPVNADALTLNAIKAFADNLKQTTGTEFRLVCDGDGNKPTENEIIVGYTKRPETAALAKQYGYAQYSLQVVGKKIVVFGYCQDSIQKGLDYLTNNLTQATSGNNIVWKVPQKPDCSGTFEGWKTGVPLYTDGVLQGTYNCGDNTYEVSVGDTNMASYKAYLDNLGKKGFQEYTSNQIGINVFATYRSKTTAVFANFYPNTEVCQIIVEPLGYLPATSAGSYNKVVSPSLIQPMRTAWGTSGYGDAGGNGLLEIVQLDDGSFIIVDGGNADLKDCKNLYNLLVSKTPGGKEPVIAAWFLTHPHPDHVGLPIQFWPLYAGKIKVELFVYNFATSENAGGLPDDNMSDYVNALQNISSEISQCFPSAKICKVHSGEKFYLRNSVVDMIYTQDDLYPTPLTFVNDTSLTFRITVDGTKIMILGDLQTNGCTLLTKEYGTGTELKSEILQPAHHGYNGGTIPFYQLIKPSVCLWCCPETCFQTNAIRKYAYSMYLINLPNEKHYSSSYTTTIMLPYKP